MNKEYITYLVELNNAAALKRLLQFEQATSPSFDLNQVNAQGQGILHYAVQLHKYEVVQVLLELGCSTTMRDVFCKTAQDYSECDDSHMMRIFEPQQGQEILEKKHKSRSLSTLNMHAMEKEQQQQVLATSSSMNDVTAVPDTPRTARKRATSLFQKFIKSIV